MEIEIVKEEHYCNGKKIEKSKYDLEQITERYSSWQYESEWKEKLIEHTEHGLAGLFCGAGLASVFSIFVTWPVLVILEEINAIPKEYSDPVAITAIYGGMGLAGLIGAIYNIYTGGEIDI